VDASVLAPALAAGGIDGDRARSSLVGRWLWAPDLIDLEVLSIWRRQSRVGQLTEHQVREARADLLVLPLRRVPHRALLARCWTHRHNLTVYDAAYVAVAELLDAPLVTADSRLAAPGVGCAVELVTTDE